MKELNQHTTLREIKALLDDSSTRDVTIETLKNHSTAFDDVKGLIELLKKNNWNYQAIKVIEDNTGSDFEALLNQSEKFKFPWLKVAAVVVPLIGLTIFFTLYFQGTNQTDELYAKYYIEEKGLPTLMSNSKNKKFDEAMAAFKDGAYDEAEKEFSELYKINSKNDTIQYFLACANMEQQNLDSAIKLLNKVQSESVFREKAQYRLPLCYIKIKEYSKAKEILIQISQDETHAFNKKASEMLEESIFD